MRRRRARADIDGMPRCVTIRQVYALAHALCVKVDEPWPETFGDASDLIRRLRIEIGHPHPELEETPLRPRRPRWKRRLDRELHELLIDDLLVGELIR